MRLLVFTTLFPWPAVPHHGIFVLERLKAYLRRHGGEVVVIAPVPWIPRALARGSYEHFRDVPAEETREGLRVLHPRYLLIPKIGMSLAPLGLAAAGMRALRRLEREGLCFDLIDAHYLYPDAVAAARIARARGLPLVVTARGTDVSLIPRHALPRRWLRWMFRRAAAGITVCRALAEGMRPLHADSFPVHVLSNGVDLDKFRPLDRTEARRSLGWEDRPTVLSVGHLIERKGHHWLIDALPHLLGLQAKIVGQGPLRESLQRRAHERGVADRVEFVGVLPHDELHRAYSAADVLVLLSSREGWPNVVLEGLACGTPVVATRVWGTPEILEGQEVGCLVDSTAPEAVAAAITRTLEAGVPREAARSFAEGHSWDRTADGMDEVFRAAVATGGAR